jgi:tetratricopeptide (TPR) repeat protein
MADIFISYTSSDRDWAFWIAHELEALGHVPHVHEWEIPAGGDIMAWITQRHSQADHILCVCSKEYFNKPYSSLERLSAQWAAATDRPGFALPVVVEECQLPTLFAILKRCDLYGSDEATARQRLRQFVSPPEKPSGRIAFPGAVTSPSPQVGTNVPFPTKIALSNTPVTVPLHLVGRDDLLIEIERTLARNDDQAAITALHGLPGVGKTTLAAAYAEQHRGNYQATWWVRAQTEATLRADLVGLGARLGWVAVEEKEEIVLTAVMQRLREEGHKILLIFDNAPDPASVRSYLPRGRNNHVLITASAPAWRGIAAPIEVRVWPRSVGADYLIARTGRANERAAAEVLSDLLGGLPLAHEQAADYCERLDISFAEYTRRFQTAPARLLDTALDSPIEHGSTVAKSFALAIDEANRRHPAAEPLIVHAALLAAEPIPLFLFAEARDKFDEPLASELAGDGIDEAVAALRAFALVDREAIADERDPSIVTDTIRLHRLVREVAAARRVGDARQRARRALIRALLEVYPKQVSKDVRTWPRARRLDTIALNLVAVDSDYPEGAEREASLLLARLAEYRHTVLAAYNEAKPLLERSLSICERTFGPEHPNTAGALTNLSILLADQGNILAARSLAERALLINEKAVGPDDLRTAGSLNNLAIILSKQHDFPAAQTHIERALAIYEKSLGPDHPFTAEALSDLAKFREAQHDFQGARLLLERAMPIFEKQLGMDHPDTATALNYLAGLVDAQGDLAGARPLFERALAIREKVLGPEHPATAESLSGVAGSVRAQGDAIQAQSLYERVLAIREKVLGPEHPDTAKSLNDLANSLRDQGRLAEARLLYERALAISERVYGPDHPETEARLQNIVSLFDLGDAHPGTKSDQLSAIERLTKSRRSDVMRQILLNVIRGAQDTDVRCLIVAKLAQLWPDDLTRNFFLESAAGDTSPDVRILSAKYLSQIWWRQLIVRKTLRSLTITDSDERARQQVLDAVGSAERQVSRFWEERLSGTPTTEEVPEMASGYPVFNVSRFRLRDIGPIRDTGVVELDRRVNIFLGDNAAGKTTALRCLGLAAIGHAAANEVEDNAAAYLRKGADRGTIEVLFELTPDQGTSPAGAGYFAVGLEITAGSSRFSPIPDSEMSIFHLEAVTKQWSNSTEHLSALRSHGPTQFGFVCGYGAVRTFNESRFSIQAETQKRENEWVISLYRPDAWLVNPEAFAKLVRGDTSNVEGAPAGALSTDIVNAMCSSLSRLLPDATRFFEGENDLQINGIALRFGELSEGYRSLLALLGHLFRCSLKALGWRSDPTQISGMALIDELDLHLHPAWQVHVVNDFRKTLTNMQLIASTHSPLVVAALTRAHVLLMVREDDGSTTIRRPEIDPQGLGFAGVLTSIFDLAATIDQPTLDKITRRLELYAKRREWSDDEKREYTELNDHLAALGFGRELSDPYFERFATAMARRHKASVEKLTPLERRELEQYADHILFDIAKAADI